MTSLHERLCNWVQVHHLYQPKRNGLLDAYLRHHVAHCHHCQVEIQSIEMLGSSIADLNFDLASTPTDVTWARLSAALPPRDSDMFDTEPAPVAMRTNLVPRAIAITAIACTAVAFAAIFIRGNRSVTPTGVQDVANKSMPAQTIPADKPTPTLSPDAALAATREQAKSVAMLDGDASDPFSKREPVSEDSAALPPTIVKSPVHSQIPGKKPLVIATSTVDNNAMGRAASVSIEPSNGGQDVQLQAAPRFAMRASAAIPQSDQQFGAENTSSGGGGFAATPAAYTPSAAMELTESQNRLRSLLQ